MSPTNAGRRSATDERGTATVLAMALMGLLLFVAALVAAVTAIVTTHRIAQSAADLAALAGAGALQDGRDPCVEAGQVARRNGAALTTCHTHDWEVTVTVVARSRRLLGHPVELGARGRAGPVGSERG